MKLAINGDLLTHLQRHIEPFSMASHFSWESGFDPGRVLGKIAECRKIDKGRTTFDGLEYHFWLPVLQSAVKSPVVGQLKRRCISNALNDPSLTLKDGDAFLKRCELAFLQLSARPKAKFVVVSTMTYSGAPFFKHLSDGETRITWGPKSSSKFMRAVQMARKEISHIKRSFRIADEGPGLTTLLAHVDAYDVYDAQTTAIDSMDSMRGILNLFVNSNRSVNPFAGMARPHAVNRFRSGPFRTIHNTDGSLATETVWYEHRWLHEAPTVKFKDGPEKFGRDLRSWWRKLQDNPLHHHIRQGLLRYCRALDTHEPDSALLQMWGAIESLTGTQSDNHKVIAKRAAHLFSDREDAKEVANHIRVRRNYSIHAAQTLNQEEADAVLVHAETLARRLLFFSIQHGKRFSDASELFQFLDLTTNQAKLQRTIALSKFSMEYQARKPQ